MKVKRQNRMGTFYVRSRVENHLDRLKVVIVPKIARGSGQRPQHPQYRICHYPSGQVLHDRSGRVCGKRDVPLLGARTLEGLNLTVGPKRQKLVAAGPLLAAGTERSWKPCSASGRVRRRSAVTRTGSHCVPSAAHNDAKLVVSVVID